MSDDAKKKTDSRRKPQADVKRLFGRAANRCAFPDCKRECTEPATDTDGVATIGDIAHIYAHSDGGPRSKPDLTSEERDCYDNWVLLCATHHRLVDAQESTYPAEELHRWKVEHEAWVQERLTEEMKVVTFKELADVTTAILGKPVTEATDFTVIEPREKMKRNNLTTDVDGFLRLGKAREVASFVERETARHPNFPDRLKAGFVLEYFRLKDSGFEGDGLFNALWDFATLESNNIKHKSAALAVLAYLFEICEVFEK
jgi:hypothetical protein